MTEAIKNRYEFVLLFDVKDGNPNGDPDAGNLPRLDPETGNGLVTDVCLKRKVRNYIQQTKQSAEGFKIFVEDKAVLNERIEEAYQKSEELKKSLEAWALWKKDKKKNEKPKIHFEDIAKAWMCENYFDIRTFGAVLATGEADKEDESKIKKTAGQVLGATQLTFSRSIDRIFSQEHAITRMAVTNEKDRDKERTIGRKYTVPYGLYRGHGFISANFAEKTGFSKDDLKLLFEALENMFETDRSASRGEMALQKLIIFEHTVEFTGSESEEEKQKKINCQKLGFAPAHKLFDKIKIEKKKELKDKGERPRKFAHYDLAFDNNEEITQSLNSDQTVITISVKGENDLSLNKSPEWRQ